MVPEVGQTICSRVRLDALGDERIGSSIFGQTITAHLTDTEERLLLTIVDRKLTPSQKDLSRFMAGANALPMMRHPTLVRVGLVDREADFAVVGYEALPGARAVTELVEQARAQALVVRAAAEIARGLAFLHRRDRAHGALSTGSVLLWEGAPVLIQYGVAELCDAARLAEASSKMGGDPVAPEVREGSRPDARADVFAWGVVLASMASLALGGEAVMAGREPGFTAAGSRDLGRLIRDALSEDPDARPVDAVEILERLQTVNASDALGTDVSDLARRYLAEVAQSADPLPALDPPTKPAASSGEDEATPRDGAKLSELVEQEREVEAQRQALEDQKAKWGKAPAPLPVKLEASKPPPPPVAKPRGERAPARPHEPVVRSRQTTRQTTGQSGATEEDLDVLLRAPEPAAAPQKKKKKKKPAKPAVAPAPAPSSASDRIELDVNAMASARRSGGFATSRGSGSSPAQSMSRPVGELTRASGSHGPRGPGMAAALAAVCTLVALGLTIPVAAAQGGLASVLGLREPAQPPSMSQDAAPPSPSDADPAAIQPPPAITQCPDDMVSVGVVDGSRVCIDEGEHPGMRHRPATLVSFEEAAAACEASGKRLCTQREWLRACAGEDGRPFPYGFEHEQDHCNEAFPSGGAHNLSRVGARDGCVSPVGAHDMVGNVQEWVEGEIAMGGDATTVVPRCGSSQRLPPKTATASLGFRCCLTLSDPAARP